MSGGARWAMLLHGGAKDIAPGEEAANRAGCLAAMAPGIALLAAGGSALDAVEAVIRALEDDPAFNAGTGSVRNADGEVEMDAAIMDGATLALGAVAAIRNVRNPISVARLLLGEPTVLLVGEGAERFARERGAEPRAAAAPGVEGGRHDTVGAVALDMLGHVAAGTSTGGLAGTPAGRVGDSPLPGCGLYADDRLGAVSLSGTGEEIARALLAAHVMRDLEAGADAQAAAEAAMWRLERVGGEAGAIVIGRDGTLGWAHGSPHFAVAIARAGAAPAVFLRRAEEEGRG